MKETDKACFFFEDAFINFDKKQDIFITNIIICILNCVLSLATCFGNFLVLFTIRKTQDLHLPSFVLLGCLAASDAIVGLICQPLFVAFKIAELKESLTAFCTLKMLQSLSGWLTTGATLAVLTAVSVDRLLALTLHLRYNAIVTVPRVFQSILAFWILWLVANVIRFWMTKEWYLIPIVAVFITFFIITFSTIRIFQIVRRHLRQITGQTLAAGPPQANTVNVLKCRKSAVTVLYIYGLVCIFYLPFLIVLFIDIFYGYTRTVRIAYDFAVTAVFINSCLNPVVYCWRIGEIRRAVKNVLRKE